MIKVKGSGGGVNIKIATATAADVLSGQTFYSGNSKDVQTGTLALSGNAAAAQVLKGYTFYNTNAKSKLTGTLTGDGMLKFASGTATITLFNPTNGLSNYGYISVTGLAFKPIAAYCCGLTWNGIRIGHQGGFVVDTSGNVYTLIAGTDRFAVDLLASLTITKQGGFQLPVYGNSVSTFDWYAIGF